MFLTELPAANSVRIGRLFYKPGAVSSVLSKSVRLVSHEVIYEGESTFGVAGSCTLISFDDKKYVVTTRHQLKVFPGARPSESQLDTLRFSTSDGKGTMKNIPVNLVIHETSNPTEEYHDLLFFRVEPTWLANSADRAYFFPLEGFSAKPRLITYFYGHPLERNEFHYEPLHAFIRIAEISGRLDFTHRTYAEHVRGYTYDKPDYDVNGFSGGAAFSLFRDSGGGFHMALDGIIVRGGNGRLHVVTVDYLLLVLIQQSR